MKIIIACCLTLAFLGLFGCSDDKNNDGSPNSQNQSEEQQNEAKQKEAKVWHYYCESIIYPTDRTTRSLKAGYQISDQALIDHIIEVLRNNCEEVSPGIPYCRSEVLTDVTCYMNIPESDRETINNAMRECSQQFVNCQDESSVCQKQREECEAKADPCNELEISAETCSETHRDELNAYLADKKSEKEIIEEEIRKYEEANP